MTYEIAASNRIALHAVRSILNAAQPFEFAVEGIPVRVDVNRLPSEPWPSYKLEGLDEATDGPLPAAVQLTCRWDGGSTELLLSAEWWKTKGKYRHLVALRTTVASINREIGWVSVALPLQGGATGERIAIPAAFNSFARRDEDTAEAPQRPDFSQLKAAVVRSGLPRLSPWRMEVCTIRLPEGEVEPSPQEAFQRLIHLALLKLPFFLRGESEGITGKPLFELGDLPTGDSGQLDGASEPPDEGQNGERRGGVGPMPGGVRQYKKTFDTLLGHLQERPYSLDEFRTLLRENYDVTGKSALHSYVSVLLGLGVAEQRDKRLELTDKGEEYLREPSPQALFELLHRHFTGLLEILVVAKMNGRADTTAMRTLLPRMLGTNWKSDNQANFRRNWLLSLGATERDDDGDFLTLLGEVVLLEHASEVEPIRARLKELLEEPSPEKGDGDEERGGEEEVTGSKPLPPGEPAVPSGWEADQLDLTAELATAHTKGLELPRLLLEQACAALSSGKHLLLVGPPGTGKTELAAALVETARAEGYCAGAFTATASADWTTFDTIGGYALQRDGSLEVRPGVFLRALERRQWLVIDELNRADVDRAFGELMTVLAGRGTDTALMRSDERLISIGTEPGCTHRMPRTFRVIATMNTWDKTSLFRLSHAVQRRFALLHVDVPEDETYARLIELHASREGMDPPLPEGSLRPLKQLFSTRGMLAHRAIGPAVALDMVRYMRRRQASGDGLAEAMAMFLFPQLEGLEQEGASRMLELLTTSLAGWTSAEAVERLRLRYQELFPHLTFKSA